MLRRREGIVEIVKDFGDTAIFVFSVKASFDSYARRLVRPRPRTEDSKLPPELSD